MSLTDLIVVAVADLGFLSVGTFYEAIWMFFAEKKMEKNLWEWGRSAPLPPPKSATELWKDNLFEQI